MKRQVRLGVFETNSSSEHSIAIVNTDEFKQWQEGKLVARCTKKREGDATGNFWTYLCDIVFAPAEDKDKLNTEIMNTEYHEYFDQDNGYKRYTNPQKLIEDYNNGRLQFGIGDIYCTYEEFSRYGFDGEDWSNTFHNNTSDGKTIFGAYYHT